MYVSPCLQNKHASSIKCIAKLIFSCFYSKFLIHFGYCKERFFECEFYQCNFLHHSWISLVILTHEFQSPRTYIQAFVLYLSKLSRLPYQQNDVPTNHEKYGYPRTLIPINKNDSTVWHKCSRYGT